MANRIVQAVYDLKDNVVGKLRSIGDALRGHRSESDRTTTAVNRNNERISASYAASAQGIGRLRALYQGLRGAIVGVFAGLSLRGAVEWVKDIALLGDAAERTRNQFAQLYGSQAEGQAVLARLAKFANDNGLALDKVQASAAKLKNFGIDPLNGSLQSLVDQNAAAGGSQEDLEGKILAVGQAWAKQKLQGEEILQLVERGVPVWELLTRVTGKNVAELQKLSEQGKLGRREISALLAEIGKMNSGAAATNANTLSGLFAQLSSRVRQFFTDVSNSGPLDYFKQKLRDAIAVIDRLAGSDQLEAWARKVGDVIVRAGEGVASAGKFFVDHIGLITALAKAYAAFRITTFVASIASGTRALLANTAAAIANAAAVRANAAANAASATSSATNAAATAAAATAAQGASGAFSLFARAVGFIRGNPIILAIAAAAVYTAGKLVELSTAIDDLRDANRRLADEEDGARQARDEVGRQLERLLQAGERYKNTLVLQAGEVEKLTGVEARSYAQRLERAEGYYRALRLKAKLAGDDLAMADADEKLAALDGALKQAEERLKSIETQAKAAGERMSDFAEQATIAFDTARAQGKTSREAVGKIFDDFDFTKADALQKVVETIGAIGARGREAGLAIREELASSIASLSGTELLEFQRNSTAAFSSVKISVRDSSEIVKATLLAAMQKLGVEPEKFALGMSKAGAETVATFRVVAENVKATGAQIEAAFTAAIRTATSKQDVEALGLALKQAVDGGRISLEAAERAGLALQSRLREIAIAANPLGDMFATLGIKSQQELNALRDSARAAFEEIVKGARRGEASQEDVNRAFRAYAATARAAVADSAQWQQSTVESNLRVEASVYGVRDALDAAGDAGGRAGASIAAGADQATEALGRTADATGDVTGGMTQIESSSGGAASGLHDVAAAGEAAADSVLGASAAFADAAATRNGLDRVTFNLLTEQQARYDAELAAVREGNAALDERGRILSSLRSQYAYLSEAQLQTLANEKYQLEQAQQRKTEQAKESKTQVEIVHTVKASGSGRAVTQAEFDAMLQAAGRSGRLGQYFNDSLRNAMRNAGASGGR